jgi:hypothetical protein
MVKTYNDALEWAAKWIEDTLRAGPETHVRTIEFGTNMAMTLRAAKLSDADLPRATADYQRGLLDAAAIAEHHRKHYRDNKTQCVEHVIDLIKEAATKDPRATGETTVEAALDELREMFPGKVIMVRREDGFYPPDCRDAAETNSMVTIKIGYLESEPKFRSFRSLADCMAQVRAASRTEGSHEPIDSSQATHESNTSTLTPEGTARPKMI